MTTPYVAYQPTVDTSDFAVPFPFLNRTHVKVKVNGVPALIMDWPSDATLRLFSPAPSDALVEIWRDTPVDEALVTYQDGNILNANDLNTAMLQLLYRQQEISSTYERNVEDALVRIGEAGGVAVPVEDVLNTIAGEIANDAIVGTFYQRVADIDNNAANILTHTNDLIAANAGIAAVNVRADTLDATAASLQTQANTLQTDLTTLTATVDALAGADPGAGVATLIQNEENARIAADQAMVDTVALIGAKSGDNLSFIANLNTLRVSAGETFSQRFSALSAADATNAAAIVTEETARINAIAVEASRIDLVTARMDTAEADIISEQTARVNGDNAIAADLALIGVANAGGTAFIVDTSTTEIGGGETLAQRLSTLAAADSDNAASIVTEQSARIAGDNAIATDLALLGAANVGGTAFVLDAATTEVSPGVSLATRLSGIDASVNANAATIVAEQTARADGDTANANAITTLQTTVDGNTASVNTLQSSVNGLEAKYGVTLDVNGYVTGFAQNNDGQTGVFQILADKFQIVDPAGGPGATSLVPFEVSGGIVKIKNAAIDNLDVGKLADGALSANITQNGDWNVGSGKITWDNGTYMKVAGVGFGTANQFIEWFGPKKAVALCDEATAIQYLKTNGDAYFGGTLSAGTLKNGATSTAHASDASITVGPFGTNGNPIQAVLSYTLSSNEQFAYGSTFGEATNWDTAVSNWGATSSGSGDNITVNDTKSIPCTVTIPLKLDGVTVATLNLTSSNETISGTRPYPPDLIGGDLTYTRTVIGSLTYTDNSGGTVDKTFEASITTRSADAVYPGGTITQQKLSIITTEQ